jgi:GNAT superfamily N-acetyltransferase
MTSSSLTQAVMVRAPRGTEWTACRTLIPEAFPDTTSAVHRAPEALLAFDAATGTALGCATFQRGVNALVHLRVRVLRNSRRRGIGASLLRTVMRTAAHSEAIEVHARVNTRNDPEAEPFLRACGFGLKSRTFTVEAAWEPLCGCISRLRKRMIGTGRIPAGVRITSIADVAPEPLAQLYTSLVVPELGLSPDAAIPLITDPRFAGSPVLLVDGRPAGLLLIQANDGRNVCVVVARVVAPERQGGGWANLLLLAEGFERSEKQGAVRMRFEAPRDNPDTVKLISRAQGEITAEIAWFVRPTTQGDEV